MPCWLYNSDDDGTEDEDQDEDDVSDSDQVDCINKIYGVCPMQLFHLEQAQRDFHPVQNLLLWTKFHQNRMIFR